MEYTGFSKEELFKCTSIVAKTVLEPVMVASKRRLGAVKEKYASEKYNFVSSLPPPKIHTR